MPPIRVIIAGSIADLQAEGIRAAVDAGIGGEMQLLGEGVVSPGAVVELLKGLPPMTPCAVILVHGRTDDASDIADYKGWLDEVDGLILVNVAIGDETIEIVARNVGMDALLAALRSLLTADGDAVIVTKPMWRGTSDRASATSAARSAEIHGGRGAVDDAPPLLLRQPVPLLAAAIDWAHRLLHTAVERLIETVEDGAASVRMAAVADWLDNRPPCTPLLAGNEALAKAERVLDEAFDDALAGTGTAEPLARLIKTLRLDATEARLLILTLVPELDPRYQRWISLLLDDNGRRCGTIGLFAELIGDSVDVVSGIAASGSLARWQLLETHGASMGGRAALPAADEPVRVDAALRDWLLGGSDALERDDALRGVLQSAPWPGTSLIGDGAEREEARALFAQVVAGTAWLVLDGDALPGWRALIETGAAQAGTVPLRVALSQMAERGDAQVEDITIRLARLARLTGRPLALDADGLGTEPELARKLAVMFGVLEAVPCRGAVLASDPVRIAGCLGAAPYRIEHRAHGGGLRTGSFRVAAAGAGAKFTEEAAESLINLFPLEIDGFEAAMRVALARPLAPGDAAETSRQRFIAACKDVAAEGASGLAQRIEPSFSLDDLVLSKDRKDQLLEIVSNIALAPKVLDGWKFRDQLPYGLGVVALFHGPSGTGKTMAALAVAKTLGVQVLRIDLSRLVSKYYGETEKNIDRIFVEAQRSGGALLIDEADGLLSRRGEVKDANDRSANIEIAYLLQRLEAHEGLVILTTNLRQNIDSAFLRRIRFVIDFPRPDAAAREAIWRKCFPAGSFELSDSDFRLLARRVELTGGSIRQITLRAAFVAAANKPPRLIGMTEIAQATRAEYAKLGVPPVAITPVAAERQAA